MKKYTVEEIKKWLNQYDPVFSGPNDIIADLNIFGEKTIDDANGYTPDTHVEDENKFEQDTNLLNPDREDYIEKLYGESPDPSKDSIY